MNHNSLSRIRRILNRRAAARNAQAADDKRAPPKPKTYTETRTIRGREAWAPNHIGNAFKNHLPYYVRQAAKRDYYRACGRVQRSVAALTETRDEGGYRARVRSQISPFYTRYPAPLAALASIGLTGFLEYKARVSRQALTGYLEEQLLPEMVRESAEADQEGRASRYLHLARMTTETVQTRLLLEDLARNPELAPYMEIYRQFACAMHNLRFVTVRSILEAVILYGDLLPERRRLEVHPLTGRLLDAIGAASEHFLDRIGDSPSHLLGSLGTKWVRLVLQALAPFVDELPAPESESGPGAQLSHEMAVEAALFPHLQEGTAPEERPVPPLDAPAPPLLLDRPNLPQLLFHALRALLAGHDAMTPEQHAALMQSLKRLALMIDRAGGQQNRYDDIRSDLLEFTLAFAGFADGPLSGQQTDGREVHVRLTGDRHGSEELYDRPVDLSEDTEAVERWRRKARPITAALRRALYPNVRPVARLLRTRPSGQLDSRRLPMAGIQQAVFKQYRVREELDRRGSPVLLIACDGSGSLNPAQMEMLKTLTWAWIESTLRTDVLLLAGLYHSGSVRDGAPGTLVEWIYHPRKTPTATPRDALRAIPSLPDDGTGVQADTLSLSFMLDEARQLARGRNVYLILLSDCCWNVSFPHLYGSGFEEVTDFFKEITRSMGDALHVTLVGLGVHDETGLEPILDKVIPVPDEDLRDPGAVAERVGLYVAGILRERHRRLLKS